jgi:hypothetical protein
MRRYRTKNIEVPSFPVVRLTFDDGFIGDLDLSGELDRGPSFEPLKDETYFRTVAIADDGRSFGWRLDRLYSEIDFGADGARGYRDSAGSGPRRRVSPQALPSRRVGERS